VEINADIFKEWFINRFLNYLKEGSIIIMDNANYNSTIRDKAPDRGSSKKDIQE
jgi:predicted O-methyltransferase YrrM